MGKGEGLKLITPEKTTFKKPSYFRLSNYQCNIT